MTRTPDEIVKGAKARIRKEWYQRTWLGSSEGWAVANGFGPTITAIVPTVTPSGKAARLNTGLPRADSNASASRVTSTGRAKGRRPGSSVIEVGADITDTPNAAPPVRPADVNGSSIPIPARSARTPSGGMGLGATARHLAALSARWISPASPSASLSSGWYQITTRCVGSPVSAAITRALAARNVGPLGARVRWTCNRASSAFAARSCCAASKICCSASTVRAVANSVASLASSVAWRWLMRRPVSNAPQPKMNVKATTPTLAQLKTLFQDSRGNERTFFIKGIATSLLAGMAR